MNVYHLAYDQTAASVDIHFWTKCSFSCRSCYVPYNYLDFGICDDPLSGLNGPAAEMPDRPFLSLDEVLKLLSPYKIKSSVFVGTEPSLDVEMPNLAQKLHALHNTYNILLTNGYFLPDISDIDEMILSIKAYTPEIHQFYTGRDNNNVLDNFKTVYQRGKKLQAETVLIPGLIEEDEIVKIASFVSSIDTNIPLRIDAYFPVGDNPWPAAEAAQVQNAAKMARNYLKTVNCLTIDMKRIGEKPVRLY